MEDGFALVECMHGEGGSCVISPACRSGRRRQALQAFLAVFDDVTLADVVKNRSELAELLEMGHVPVRLPDRCRTRRNARS